MLWALWMDGGLALPARMRFIDSSGGSKWSAVKVDLHYTACSAPAAGFFPDGDMSVSNTWFSHVSRSLESNPGSPTSFLYVPFEDRHEIRI